MNASSKTGSKSGSTTKTKKSSTKSASAKTKKAAVKKKTGTAAAKTSKTGKTRSTARSVKEKPVKTTVQSDSSNDAVVIVERALVSIERLGGQTFALSPFSQYYDDWLGNLRQIVTEFETGANVKVDKGFTEKCEQILLDMQTVLSNLRIQESALAENEKTLLEVNQELKDLDANYSKKKHELNNNHNTDTEQLTTQIKKLENDIEVQGKAKVSFFQFSAKKAAAKKLEQTKQNLEKAKNQLETAQQNLPLEQAKIQEDYTVKKQELTDKADTLRKEAEKLEIDMSREARKETCTRLKDIINEQIKDQAAKPSN
ncbi:MAG: hypothetical protein FWF66_03550 [Candidatus Bathyarchaeota archaeon]|nr:hypothetical protein [Candidatus Termiticorpusculum sp.]